jgi:hypothetical protein
MRVATAHVLDVDAAVATTRRMASAMKFHDELDEGCQRKHGQTRLWMQTVSSWAPFSHLRLVEAKEPPPVLLPR